MLLDRALATVAPIAGRLPISVHAAHSPLAGRGAGSRPPRRAGLTRLVLHEGLA
jgi:hypothetical protein